MPRWRLFAAVVVCVCLCLGRFGRAPRILSRSPGLQSPLGAGISAAFDSADADGDGKLSRLEFEAAAAALAARSAAAEGASTAAVAATVSSSTVVHPAPTAPQPSPASSTADTAGAAAERHSNGSTAQALPPLPQCSLLFFYHLEKTAGTTMRMVLQRNAQLGEWEYMYTGSTSAPRWQLIVHTLQANPKPRRLVVEVHSPWGIQRGFFADVHRLRELYSPIGCRVSVMTVLRQPLAWLLSMYNWRAANFIPLCAWHFPLDGLSRQLTGHGLPFVKTHNGRELRLPLEAPLSVLRHFDLVGLTEMLDETLLLLRVKAGVRHLAYAKLAENQKRSHPALAKRLLAHLMKDAGVTALTEPLLFARADGSGNGGGGGGGGEARSAAAEVAASEWEGRWSAGTVGAASEFNSESTGFVEGEAARGKKADCNYYHCAPPLEQAGGTWNRSMCTGVSPQAVVSSLLWRTAVDRAVHAEVVRRLRRELREARLEGPELQSRLAELRAASAELSARRAVAIGRGGRNLCGTQLCGNTLRSCIGCENHPVPGIEACWPKWEDQFSPDEASFWCRRTFTIPGFDLADRTMRHQPKVAPIPCWQTCWEHMRDEPAGPFGKAVSCLSTSPPDPRVGPTPGGCAQPLSCSPACPPAKWQALADFWKDWKAHPVRQHLDRLNITCPCGPGG